MPTREELAFLTLLAAWRTTREPRLGELIEDASAVLAEGRPALPKKGGERHRAWLERAASPDPLELGILLPALAEPRNSRLSRQRLDALTDWPPDPRIGRALLFLLIQPPFHVASTLPFWTEACRQLAVHADTETARHLRAIAGTYSSITNFSVGPVLDSKVDRLIGKLEKEEARPTLTDDDWERCTRLAAFIQGEDVAEDDVEAMLDALAEVFGSPARPYELQQKGRALLRDEESFLREIAASPDDDDLRLVFADWLLEHGNARGEMIQLQYQRLRGGLTPRQEKREAALIRKHRGEWLKPIAHAVVLKDAVFVRGFLDTCRIGQRSFRNLVATAGDVRWSTVRKVVYSYDRRPDRLADLRDFLASSMGPPFEELCVVVPWAFFRRWSKELAPLGELAEERSWELVVEKEGDGR